MKYHNDFERWDTVSTRVSKAKKLQSGVCLL
jgi:hypothetical protein